MNGTKLRGVGLIWDKVSLTKCVCVCVCLFVMRVCVCVCDEGDDKVCELKNCKKVQAFQSS